MTHFVNGVIVLGVDDRIARRFGQIKTQLRRSGQLIPDFDLLIAASALVYNLTLITNNTAHFGRIPNLPLANWLN
ncbi:MAG TPA: type II toxin-antitoxin system VapC family toxin [Anaerolineae bacterium]|nr:type II toxin-antitoxin system VapC family toxin [Anaerolineae bacterium]